MGREAVLIVEPNPGIMIVGRNVLARAGFDVVAASCVEDGLVEARRRKFDLILLDGRTSEPEVLMAFASTSSQGVPIILTVQRGRDILTIEALEDAGWHGLVNVAEVIDKPFSPESLLHAVAKAIRRSFELTDPYLELAAELIHIGSSEFELERTEKHEALGSAMLRIRMEAEEGGGASLTLHDEGTRRLDRLTAVLRRAAEDEDARLEPRQLRALARAAEDFYGRDVGEASQPAASGEISQIGLDHLLQLAASVAPPARLLLEQGEQRIEIFLDAGNVVFARQSNLPDAYTLGRVLVATGVVEQRQIDWSLAQRGPSASGPIGKRLLSFGLVRPNDVSKALVRQTEELVYEAVRWGEGRFSLIPRDPLPPEAVDAGVVLPVHHLLLEGMRRLDEYRRIAREVGDLGAVVGRMDRPTELTVLESLPAEERLILEQIDGRRTIEDLVRSLRRTTYDIVKAVHHLRGQRLVTVHYPMAEREGADPRFLR